MRFGASTFIWTSPFGDDRLELLGHVAELGFETIEICIEDPARVTAAAVRAAAEAAGLGVLVCGAFGSDRDVSHEDPGVRAQRIGYLRTCVEIAAGVGSPIVVGPMYSATGKARLLPEDERAQQWAWAVDGLRAAADHAAEHGVTLAIEPLNRFETDLVNTVDQGVRLCEEIDRPNAGLLLDTFHMNIEERSIGDAIRHAGRHVKHFHTCENDRGAPGSGHVGWDAVFAALDAIAYDGDVVIESFTPEIVEIARAVSMWRPLAPDGDTLARDGLRFLRAQRAKVGA